MTAVTDVVLPASLDEAVQAFADGRSVTVIGGGTIVMPEISAGRLRPTRAILLARAGLAGVSNDGAQVTIGAMTTLEQLAALGAPIGPCAANIADIEVRSQATLGGNLCAGHGEVPRGDLQGPLLAVDAEVTSAAAGSMVTQPLAEFLPAREGRLVLQVGYEQPAAAAFVALDRPHAHEYTTLAVSAARLADGSVRLAATGVASHGVRLPSAEAAAADPEAAGKAALADVQLHDDALASAWYRERALPVLVKRALAKLEESRWNLNVNGTMHELGSPPLVTLLDVLREELGITSPKAGCEQGGCGSCTVLVDGEPRRACLLPLAAVDGAAITTVEGLGTAERLGPVQAAFHEKYGSQCGFCTCGFLVATHALLERTGHPSREEIQGALAGHVCRCTGYVKILESVEAAANGGSSAAVSGSRS